MNELARDLHRLLMGVWVGAVLCFAALVAPALFRTLSPGQAGGVVRQVLPALDLTTVLLIPLLLALAWGVEGRPRGVSWVRLTLLASTLVLAGVSLWGVSPRMEQLRQQAEDRMSDLPREDPRRREFGRLHGVSTVMMGVELLLMLGAFSVPLKRRA